MKWICHTGVLALIWAALSTASSAAIATGANVSANANINVKERGQFSGSAKKRGAVVRVER